MMRIVAGIVLFVIFQHLLVIESTSEPMTRPLQGGEALQQARQDLNLYKYDSYLSFEEMEDRLRSLEKAYPDKISVEVVGKSFEGKNLYLVIVTDRPIRRLPAGPRTLKERNRKSLNSRLNDTSVGEKAELQRRNLKPVIFVDAGIHAREWVAPAAALYAIDQLVKTPSLTAELEWRIMPMVNPDGYIYSQTSGNNARYWRKNRATTSNPNCIGVDLNRNFDVFWEDTNHSPCDETYSGERAFSEPESKAVRDVLQKLVGRTQAYITIHTYGQFFLHPYGYTSSKSPPTVQKLKAMGQGMADVIQKKYRNEYVVQQASIFGDAAGGSDDWAFLAMKVPYSYTFELQTKTTYPYVYTARGFVLEAWKLPQAVDECWLALNYLGEQIIKETASHLKREDEATIPISNAATDVVQKIDGTIGINDTNLNGVNVSSLPAESAKDQRIFFADEWSRVMQDVNKSRMKAMNRVNSEGTRNDCVKNGRVYVCPHMIFWGSMFNKLA